MITSFRKITLRAVEKIDWIEEMLEEETSSETSVQDEAFEFFLPHPVLSNLLISTLPPALKCRRTTSLAVVHPTSGSLEWVKSNRTV